MDKIEIRKATINDLRNIQLLSQALIEYEYKNLNNYIINLDWSISAEGEENFKNLIQNNFVYIAECEGKIVGYVCGKIYKKLAWHTVQLAELINLYVLDEYRRKGIGTKLINEFKKYCSENNIKNIEVSTLSNNFDSMNFYKLNGFDNYTSLLIYREN